MKKILIGLFALASVSAFANEGINVYGKLSFDAMSKFPSTSYMEDDKDNSIKDEIEMGLGFPKKTKGYGIFLEATKNINPNLELGAGIGYIKRKDKNIKNLSGFSDNGKVILSRNYNYLKAPMYESIPLYLTAKYNFDIDSTIKPYVKADLGYSFNKTKDIKITRKEFLYDNLTNTTTKGKSSSDKFKVKAKNGLYLGLGVGAEYNNFLAELSYVYTQAKVQGTFEDDGKTFKHSVKYNNNAIRLSVGYKFNF